jgi:crossover junction endodeoxyribonuclease RuvC
MRIIAIDPGYERLGIAVLSRRSLEEQKTEGREPMKSGPKETLLYSECFKTKAALPFFDRLELVGREVKRVIDEFSPRALSIENLFIDNNQKTAMRVAEVRGAILYQARVSGLEIYEYTPLQIKVAITSYGKASKEQVMTMVRHLVSGAKNITQDDEMDAIAIGLTHFAHMRP